MSGTGRGPNRVLEDDEIKGDVEEITEEPLEIDVTAGVVALPEGQQEAAAGEKKTSARKGGQRRGSEAQADG